MQQEQPPELWWIIVEGYSTNRRCKKNDYLTTYSAKPLSRTLRIRPFHLFGLAIGVARSMDRSQLQPGSLPPSGDSNPCKPLIRKREIRPHRSSLWRAAPGL